MKVLYLLMLIAGLLWIGDFSITLNPFLYLYHAGINPLAYFYFGCQ